MSPNAEPSKAPGVASTRPKHLRHNFPDLETFLKGSKIFNLLKKENTTLCILKPVNVITINVISRLL